MDKWLSIIQVKDWVLPDPEWSITTITSSWSTLMIQWELTQTMAERLLKMSWDITDPVDSNNPIYSVTEDNKYFQVALFLEAGNLASSNITHPNLPFTREGITQKVHAADGKTILTKWSELWIILTADETPVNQQSTHATTVELTTTTNYVAYLNENEKIEVSGTELAEKIEIAIAKTSSRWSSCKEVLERWWGSVDWNYTIYPNWEALLVYCDMTTNWGGWTRLELETRQWWNAHWFNSDPISTTKWSRVTWLNSQAALDDLTSCTWDSEVLMVWKSLGGTLSESNISTMNLWFNTWYTTQYAIFDSDWWADRDQIKWCHENELKMSADRDENWAQTTYIWKNNFEVDLVSWIFTKWFYWWNAETNWYNVSVPTYWYFR